MKLSSLGRCGDTTLHKHLDVMDAIGYKCSRRKFLMKPAGHVLFPAVNVAHSIKSGLRKVLLEERLASGWTSRGLTVSSLKGAAHGEAQGCPLCLCSPESRPWSDAARFGCTLSIIILFLCASGGGSWHYVGVPFLSALLPFCGQGRTVTLRDPGILRKTPACLS